MDVGGVGEVFDRELDRWLDNVILHQPKRDDNPTSICRLYKAIKLLYKTIQDTATLLDLALSKPQHQQLRSQFTSLSVWGDDYEVLNGKLDSQLNVCTDLRCFTLGVLVRLHASLEKFIEHAGVLQDLEVIHLFSEVEVENVRLSLLDNPDDDSDNESDAGCDEGEATLDDCLDDLQHHIDCLFDLGPRLDEPIPDIALGGEVGDKRTLVPHVTATGHTPEQSSRQRKGKNTGKRSWKQKAGTENTSTDRAQSQKRSKTGSTAEKKFACPFYNNCPEKNKDVRTSCGPGWTTTHRLREHVYRRHVRQPSCPRCLEQFDGKEALDVHKRAPSPCKLRVHEGDDGDFSCTIDENQEKQLRKRYKGSEEDRWTEMYRIIFPDATHIPSSYMETPEEINSTVRQNEAETLQETKKRIQDGISRMLRPIIEREVDLMIGKMKESMPARVAELIHEVGSKQLYRMGYLKHTGEGKDRDDRNDDDEEGAATATETPATVRDAVLNTGTLDPLDSSKSIAADKAFQPSDLFDDLEKFDADSFLQGLDSFDLEAFLGTTASSIRKEEHHAPPEGLEVGTDSRSVAADSGYWTMPSCRDGDSVAGSKKERFSSK
ncbi:hypothetical protein B0H66DRAFT_551465 [Apodospora peruviana]|uniref:C2H2-type domain-containing protein n=1 Tax=Apodospora peruviana TaxID=516989 RepID=A0AAE0MCH1_9PEZI|nr:hypothetical protein B0H66DRAFT_551465 [Apodospora peruviana]